jgi:hypothetical protein
VTVKDPSSMTDRELMDAYELLATYGEVLSGPFPEERAAALALELGRRSGVSSHRLYRAMLHGWHRGDGKPWRTAGPPIPDRRQ